VNLSDIENYNDKRAWPVYWKRSFNKADLRWSIFENSNIASCSFHNASLYKANLKKIQKGALLCFFFGADLREAEVEISFSLRDDDHQTYRLLYSEELSDYAHKIKITRQMKEQPSFSKIDPDYFHIEENITCSDTTVIELSL
jgi:hypothetical protein